MMAAIDHRPGTSYAGLVLNEKGYERAVRAGVDEVRYAFPVTETFARRNQNTSVADATDLAEKLTERARLDGVRVSITLSAAFGDPFEGRVDPAHVLDIAERVSQAAPDEIVLADTIGVGDPERGQGAGRGHARVRDHRRLPLPRHPQHRHGQRHSSRRVGVDGARRLCRRHGGCPFAPRATGNIATEDLVYLLHGMGYEMGIDLDALIEVAGWMAQQLGKELSGQVYKAGTFEPVAG